jgi:hypothetical protein
MATPARKPKRPAANKSGTERAPKAAVKQVPPPPPKGNRLAVKHGAKAEPPAAAVNAIEQEIYEALAAAAPVRENGALPAADAAMVRLCAKTLARLQGVSDWIDAHGGPLHRDGKPKSAALWERRLSATATKQLASLGMSPAARVKIGAQLATVDLSMALSEPDEAKRAALMQQAGLQPGAGA